LCTDLLLYFEVETIYLHEMKTKINKEQKTNDKLIRWTHCRL